MMVSVVTASTGRPKSLALCREWVEAQDYQGGLEHVVGEGGSFHENIYAALERSVGDAIVFMEDDDFYEHWWVSWCVDKLCRGYDIVGQEGGRFYHLPTGGNAIRGKNPEGRVQTWAMATAMRADATAYIKARALVGKASDAQLWGTKCRRAVFPGDGFVSIKGNPERLWYADGGSGGKHRADHEMWRHRPLDTSRELLADWVGGYAAGKYLDILTCA